MANFFDLFVEVPIELDLDLTNTDKFSFDIQDNTGEYDLFVYNVDKYLLQKIKINDKELLLNDYKIKTIIISNISKSYDLITKPIKIQTKLKTYDENIIELIFKGL